MDRAVYQVSGSVVALVVLVVASLMLGAGALGAGSIVLDASSDPVAVFPGDVEFAGDVDVSGHNISNVDRVNGLRLSALAGEFTENIDLNGNNISNVENVQIKKINGKDLDEVIGSVDQSGAYGDGSDGTVTRSSNSFDENGALYTERYTLESGSTARVSDGILFVSATESITIDGTIDARGVFPGGDGGQGDKEVGGGYYDDGSCDWGTCDETADPGEDVSGTYFGGGTGGDPEQDASGYSAGGGGGGVSGKSTAKAGGDSTVEYDVARIGLGFWPSPLYKEVFELTAEAGSPGAGGGGGEAKRSHSECLVKGGGGGDGGDGGGIVVLIAPTIDFTGTIDASGTNGQNGGNGNIKWDDPDDEQDCKDTSERGGGGGGGGGSGGVIVFVTENFNDDGTVKVSGGNGGNGKINGGDGADGEDGIKIVTTP